MFLAMKIIYFLILIFFAFCNSFLIKDMIYLMNIEEEIRDKEDNKGISYVKKRIKDFEH